MTTVNTDPACDNDEAHDNDNDNDNDEASPGLRLRRHEDDGTDNDDDNQNTHPLGDARSDQSWESWSQSHVILGQMTLD